MGRDLAAGDLRGGDLITVVEGVVRVAIEGDHGAIERHTREQTARAGIGIDLGVDAGSSFALTSYGAGGHRGIGAQGEFAACEVLNARSEERRVGKESRS